MNNENINDLEKYEKDLINKKKESQKTNPFSSKSSFDFWKINLNKKDFKNIIFSRVGVSSFLWGILVIFIIYSYNTDIFKKVEELPTLKKNLSIVNDNIKKQEDELASLDKINLDLSSLESKETILDLNLPEMNDNLDIEQTNKLYQIAKEIWLEVDSLQKIDIKRDEKKVEELGTFLDTFWIENFYENAWYTKYIISTTSSEKVILRFKEKTEGTVEFIFDSFSLNQSDDELKYNFSIKAFYSLNNDEDEQID